MDLSNELVTLWRADPSELLLLEAAGYTEGCLLLTAEYPDNIAGQVVNAILATFGMA